MQFGERAARGGGGPASCPRARLSTGAGAGAVLRPGFGGCARVGRELRVPRGARRWFRAARRLADRGQMLPNSWLPSAMLAHDASPLLCTSDCAAAAGCARRPQQPPQLHRRRREGPQGALVCLEATTNSRDSLLSRRSLSHRPSTSFCALLTALLLLAVPVDLSSHHSCISGVEKAHGELQFVWRRPQTPKICAKICGRKAVRAF